MEPKYDILRQRFLTSIDSLVEKEGLKLKKAVEEKGYYTGSRDGAADWLVAVGLLKCVGEYSSLFHASYLYKATPEGLKVYQAIYGEKQKQELPKETDNYRDERSICGFHSDNDCDRELYFGGFHS